MRVAFIVQVVWKEDPMVVSHIVQFAETEHDAWENAKILFQTHEVKGIERAPWLDRPCLIDPQGC